mmetsp:Transcript_14414/g.31154  ORF Transcript_14414/g.31154 Transcript_14414/m.31154 type:complete len:126 (-) Transcript_14414:630-1007(-)
MAWWWSAGALSWAAVVALAEWWAEEAGPAWALRQRRLPQGAPVGGLEAEARAAVAAEEEVEEGAVVAAVVGEAAAAVVVVVSRCLPCRVPQGAAEWQDQHQGPSMSTCKAPASAPSSSWPGPSPF